MYFQLSLRVKVMVMVKELLIIPSLPEETVKPVVESVPAAAQEAVPKRAPPLAAAQVAVMAEAGIVAHPEKVEVLDRTLRVQIVAKAPPAMVNCTVEEEDPATTPKSGSVDEKLMVLGVAVKPLIVVAAGACVKVTVLRPAFTWPAARLVAISTIANGKRGDMFPQSD